MIYKMKLLKTGVKNLFFCCFQLLLYWWLLTLLFRHRTVQTRQVFILS